MQPAMRADLSFSDPALEAEFAQLHAMRNLRLEKQARAGAGARGACCTGRPAAAFPHALQPGPFEIRLNELHGNTLPAIRTPPHPRCHRSSTLRAR